MQVIDDVFARPGDDFRYFCDVGMEELKDGGRRVWELDELSEDCGEQGFFYQVQSFGLFRQCFQNVPALELDWGKLILLRWVPSILGFQAGEAEGNTL